MGCLGATLTQVFTRVCGADVSFRDVTIKIPDRGCDQECEWRHAPEAQMGNGATECGWRHAPEPRGGFGGFWKSRLVELSSCLGRRGLAFACSPKPCQWPLCRVLLEIGGGRWKSHHGKTVYLSPYVEEPLNSKVIKSFVPELRSRKCFSYFEIPVFYVYMLWTVYVRFAYSNNLSEISSTICLLLCDLICFQFSCNRSVWFLPWFYRSVTFINAAFKSHTKWSNVQRVCAPTTTILATMVGTSNGLNWFGHMIYVPQTNTYQNNAKLLTHPSKM